MDDDTPTPFLRITSPSPTAVKFTISSRASDTSFLVSTLRHGFRLFVVFYTVLCTIAKLQFTIPIIEDELQSLLSFMVPEMVQRIIEIVPWWVMGVICLGIVWFCVRRDYTGESDFIVSNQGVHSLGVLDGEKGSSRLASRVAPACGRLRENLEETSVKLRADQQKLRPKAENRGNGVAERERQDQQRIIHQ